MGADHSSLRVGVVGAGLMGEEHLKALELLPEIAVTCVADSDRERARTMARDYGIDAIASDVVELAGADDVDAVVVAIPPAALDDVVPVVCAHGKPVLCEKPLGVDANQARALLEAATDAGVVHALGHQRRYDPVHRRVRDLVADGFIGAPLLIAVQVMTDFGLTAPASPARRWTRARKPGGGLLLQVLSHYLDLLRFTLGDFDVVFCDAAPAPTEPPLGDADDTVLLVGTLPNGARVSVTASWSLPHPSGVTWQLHGSDGTIQITSQLRILGARRGETVRDLGLPATYRPAVGADLFAPYGQRKAFGWARQHADARLPGRRVRSRGQRHARP